jgi:hypothetical protein
MHPLVRSIVEVDPRWQGHAHGASRRPRPAPLPLAPRPSIRRVRIALGLALLALVGACGGTASPAAPASAGPARATPVLAIAAASAPALPATPVPTSAAPSLPVAAGSTGPAALTIADLSAYNPATAWQNLNSLPDTASYKMQFDMVISGVSDPNWSFQNGQTQGLFTVVNGPQGGEDVHWNVKAASGQTQTAHLLAIGTSGWNDLSAPGVMQQQPASANLTSAQSALLPLGKWVLNTLLDPGHWLKDLPLGARAVTAAGSARAVDLSGSYADSYYFGLLGVHTHWIVTGWIDDAGRLVKLTATTPSSDKYSVSFTYAISAINDPSNVLRAPR